MYNYPWRYPQYPYYYNGVPYQDNRQPIFWGNTDEIEHFNPFYYSHDHEDYMTLKDYGDNHFIDNYEDINEVLNKKIEDSIAFLANSLNGFEKGEG